MKEDSNAEDNNSDYMKNMKKISEEIAKLSKPYIDNSKKVMAAIQPLAESMVSLQKNMEPVIQSIVEMQKTIMDSLYGKDSNFRKALQELDIQIEKVKENPNSYWNLMIYEEKLSDFIWIIPYDMTNEGLQKLIKISKSEEEFDNNLSKYFDEDKIKLMIEKINQCIPNENKLLFAQITYAYTNEMFALSSIGLFTIIDNLLSYYLENKRKTSRKNLFIPIIEDLNNEDNMLQWKIIIVNNCINRLFENYDFNEKIDIKSDKKIRRHPMLHGKITSNQRIEVIMLLNLVYYLIDMQKYLNQYKDSLIWDSKNNKYKLKNNRSRENGQ